MLNVLLLLNWWRRYFLFGFPFRRVGGGGGIVLLIALSVTIPLVVLTIRTLRCVLDKDLLLGRWLLLHLLLLCGLNGLYGCDLVGVLSDYAGQVHFEFGFGCYPECPINQLKELGFEKIHLLQRDASHEGKEVVAVEDIVVELWSEQDCWQNKPIVRRSYEHMNRRKRDVDWIKDSQPNLLYIYSRELLKVQNIYFWNSDIRGLSRTLKYD